MSGRVRAGHQVGMWIVGCHVWRRETSVPFPQFCCEPKTALKMEILKKKKKEEEEKEVWKQAQRKVIKMPRGPAASYEGILRDYGTRISG